MRALVIEDLSKPVELHLLEPQCQSRRPSCFFLEGPMHSFVTTVLLRTPRLNTFVNDFRLHPSERELRHVSGLFCNGSAKYAQKLRPSRPQGVSQASALRLCIPRCARSFHSRCASFQGWERPLPLQLLRFAFGTAHLLQCVQCSWNCAFV